jgi:coenzyme F420 hydrogenase subunit beta
MYQWVLVRTEKGEQLRSLIADELETYPETSEGDRTAYVQTYAQKYMSIEGQPAQDQMGTGGPMSIEDGMQMAEYLYVAGPRGLEFVRYAAETHLIRNYYFVRENYPHLLSKLVPKHVYRILEAYELQP